MDRYYTDLSQGGRKRPVKNAKNTKNKGSAESAENTENSEPKKEIRFSESVSGTHLDPSTQALWFALLCAQRLAPDNVTINELLYTRWPESIQHLWLFDDIDGLGKLMSRFELLQYIVELDIGATDRAFELINSLSYQETLQMRVRESELIATLKRKSVRQGERVLDQAWEWESCHEDESVNGALDSTIESPSDIASITSARVTAQVGKRELLMMVLRGDPRCALGYHQLAATLNNPFERLSWYCEGEKRSFNQGQLLEQAYILDPSLD